MRSNSTNGAATSEVPERASRRQFRAEYKAAILAEALKGVSRELVRNHLTHCARRALKDSESQAQAAIDELIAVWSEACRLEAPSQWFTQEHDRPMTRTKRYLAMVIPSLILVQLAGCGSGVPARAAALDPANPNGPESPPLSVSQAPTGSPGAATGEAAHGDMSGVEGADQHAEHAHAAASMDSAQSGPPAAPLQEGSSDSSAIYTCPMHPEVKSPQPGQCPKCGMKLVPKGKPGAAAPPDTRAAPAKAHDAGSPKAAVYTCPMHPEVTSSQPGKCPKCGMNLVPKKDDK